MEEKQQIWRFFTWAPLHVLESWSQLQWQLVWLTKWTTAQVSVQRNSSVQVAMETETGTTSVVRGKQRREDNPAQSPEKQSFIGVPISQ